MGIPIQAPSCSNWKKSYPIFKRKETTGLHKPNHWNQFIPINLKLALPSLVPNKIMIQRGCLDNSNCVMQVKSERKKRIVSHMIVDRKCWKYIGYFLNSTQPNFLTKRLYQWKCSQYNTWLIRLNDILVLDFESNKPVSTSFEKRGIWEREKRRIWDWIFGQNVMENYNMKFELPIEWIHTPFS